ncbi:stage II sporulation protein P [Clostridium bornimense]|uniref:stage II sporulation protein P n=1 Tax=Clostridium bornimense TaxID=1216932 RepID=UPI001C0FD53F|nr:stage II sporulation protein P [Clostridium bornimense]MBU5315797.1 stage II sporulation protein P [Clostridium bornimense]
MGYKLDNLKKKKTIFEIILFFTIMLMLIAFCFLKFMEFNCKISKGNRNLFYVTMVNKTVPIIETVHFDNTAMVENQFTFKNIMNFLFDFSIDNPKSIIGKEFIGISIVEKENMSSNTGVKGFASDSIVIKTKENCQVEPASENGNPLLDATLNVFDENYINNNSIKPKVLIYHTHTGEAFVPYQASSRNENENIISVGEELTKELNRYNIDVVHDKTVNDGNYMAAYSASRETVRRNLATYNSFDIIIDLHRDAVSNKGAVTGNINGVTLARPMFVYDTSVPNINENLRIVEGLRNIIDRDFPNLRRDDFVYTSTSSKFNADLSTNSILIEMGSEASNLGEAKNTARIIARAISEYLKK